MGFLVHPIQTLPEKAELPCADSGSTLRFLLPVVGALGIRADFLLEGRLAQRPLSPLREEMERMGCSLTFTDDNVLSCSGKLRSGEFQIDGSISSQFVTGLLFAAALIPGDNRITVTGKLESRPYVNMTLNALSLFGCECKGLSVSGGRKLRSPGTVTVEGDWSNGAFFLAANRLGNAIAVENLNPDSLQGDRAAAALLPELQGRCVISAADIPDLVRVRYSRISADSG